jgi:hypothetical protein
MDRSKNTPTKRMALLIALALGLASCGQGSPGPKGEAGVAGPAGEKGGGSAWPTGSERGGGPSRTAWRGGSGDGVAAGDPHRLRDRGLYRGLQPG